MGEVIEAEATPLELSQLTEADRWLAEARSKVALIAAEYEPREIASEEDYAQSKRERAAARRAIKDVTDERQARTRAIKRAVADFEAQVRDLLEPLQGIDAAYKRELDAWDERVLQERHLQVAEAYAEMAPSLVPLVPYERLRELFGAAEGWDRRGVTTRQVVDMVAAHVQGIADDERTLDGLDYADEEERRATKAEYFSTLDLRATLADARARREQRERVAALERERQEREKAAVGPQEAARATQTGLVDQVPTKTESDREKGSQRPVASHEEQWRRLMDDHANAADQPAPGEPVPEMVMFCYVTRGQCAALRAYCESHGITGKLRPTHGMLYKLVPKED